MIAVHLPSGQDNDEVQLLSAVLLETMLNATFQSQGITESDRIILGDFNHDPYDRTESGAPLRTPALLGHLHFKKYANLVPEDTGYTRMSDNLDSFIDHIFANSSARRHIVGAAEVFRPEEGDVDLYARWRQDYSDHLPITFHLRIERTDDDAD